MNNSLNVLISGATAYVLLFLIMKKKTPKTESNFSGQEINLYPTAPVSPSEPITAIEYLNPRPRRN